MYRDEAANPPALVCVVGKTELRYHLRCIEDLHAMLKKHGDWMLLGSADEQKPAAEGTVEAWGRSAGNPVGGWYGLKEGPARPLRYVPAAVAGSTGPGGSWNTTLKNNQDAGEIKSYLHETLFKTLRSVRRSAQTEVVIVKSFLTHIVYG